MRLCFRWSFPFSAGFLLLAGCYSASTSTATGPGSPQALTSTGPPSLATPASTRTPSLQAATPSATLVQAPILRDSEHYFVFSSSTDQEQTIFLFHYESNEIAPILSLPRSMRHQSADGVETGLSWDEMYLSPDGEVLVTLQRKTLDDPTDYIHQVNLASGVIVSVPLHAGAAWLIPILPGREPGAEALADGLRSGDDSVVDLIDRITWAPDSRGFVLTLGEDVSILGPGGAQHFNGQLYYVARGNSEIQPLAVDAPGNDIGFGASWSPNGRYVAYRREALLSSIWLIDTVTPNTAAQIAEHVVINQWGWLPDDKGLIYSADYSTVVKVDLATLERTPLRTFEQQLGEYFLFDLAGQTSGSGYVILERREQDRQLDPTFEKLIYVDITSGDVLTVFEGKPISTAVVLPGSDEVWVTADDPRQGWIAQLPSGQIIAGPSSLLYPPTSEELEILPGVENVGSEAKEHSRSPDLNLIAGYRGEDLVVWDVLTGDSIAVASEPPGQKVFLGWVPDPGVFETVPD